MASQKKDGVVGSEKYGWSIFINGKKEADGFKSEKAAEDKYEKITTELLEQEKAHSVANSPKMQDAMGEAMSMNKQIDADKEAEKEEDKKKPGRFRTYAKAAWNKRKNKRNFTPSNYYDKKGLSLPDSTNTLIFFVLALGLHLWDWLFFGFSRNMGDGVAMFSLYAALTLAAIFLFFRSDYQDSQKIVVISLIAFLWPALGTFIASPWFAGVLIFSPIWCWYILLTQTESRILNWAKMGLLLLLICAGLFALLTSSLVEGGFSVKGRVDVSSGADWLKVIFIENTEDAFRSLKAYPGKLRTRINQTYSMSYFTGQVEDNEQEPLGVYLEDLKAMESVFYENNTVIIWATLRGKSFEGTTRVKNYCYIQTNDNQKIDGVVSPFNPELFYDESRPLECIFKDGLEKGHYTVTFTSTFEFPTWGYVEYSFVDRATRVAHYTQGTDINRELDIPKKSTMIYTNGPVSIGSNIRDMPIVIYPDSDSLQRFGVTVANIWPQGEILTLTDLEIQVPEGLELSDCLPKKGVSSVGINGYTNYNFKLESPSEFFTTETCQMDLTNKDTFLDDSLKVTKTFAVKADYIYSLDKTISIRVEDR